MSAWLSLLVLHEWQLTPWPRLLRTPLMMGPQPVPVMTGEETLSRLEAAAAADESPAGGARDDDMSERPEVDDREAGERTVGTSLSSSSSSSSSPSSSSSSSSSSFSALMRAACLACACSAADRAGRCGGLALPKLICSWKRRLGELPRPEPVPAAIDDAAPAAAAAAVALAS